MKFLSILLISLFASSSVIADDTINITNAWVRLTPTVIKNTAAYFSITNKSNKTITLSNIEAPFATMAMMHDVIEQDGMTRMVHLDSLDILSGKTAQFRPGAMHVMLTGLKQPLRDNQQVSLTLNFENNPSITLLMKVLKAAP